MKIVEIALIFLIFNFVMGIMTYSSLSEGSIYYESSYTERFTPQGGEFPHNISAGSESDQYSQTMWMVNAIFGTLTFNWALEYVPAGISDSSIISYIFLGLNSILGFLYAAAIIELFMKQQRVVE